MDGEPLAGALVEVLKPNMARVRSEGGLLPG
jgi:hypothetical protein